MKSYLFIIPALVFALGCFGSIDAKSHSNKCNGGGRNCGECHRHHHHHHHRHYGCGGWRGGGYWGGPCYYGPYCGPGGPFYGPPYYYNDPFYNPYYYGYPCSGGGVGVQFYFR